MKTAGLKERVIRAAECALAVKGVVSPIELLKQMQFLAPSHVRMWEKGVHACLYPQIQCGSKKLAQTFQIFTQWAKENELVPVAATMRGSGRDQSHDLNVTADANPEMETFFRTCYAPADITPRKLEALKKKLNKPPELVVFMTVRESVACEECGDEMLVAEMAGAIREQFPGCPAQAARQIASHTARRGSGRVGRSAAGRQLHQDAIRLAVVAHIRHEHTRYDELLLSGTAREDARRALASEIEGVIHTWKREK